MSPLGWFIPCHESGMQALYGLDRDQSYKITSPLNNSHAVTVGPKGVLCTIDLHGIQFHQVRMYDDKRIALSPLRTGDKGFAIIGMYSHLTDIMNMAVRLTTTIEEAVDMYCRHTPSNRNMVEIWDRKQVIHFMRQNFIPYNDKRNERKKKLREGK
jgi:hypothetical protein